MNSPKLVGITDVFFDLDHTLWDFERNSALTYQQIFKQHHLPIVLDDFLDIYQPLNAHLWELYQFDKIDKETLRYRRLKETFDGLNIKVSDQEINQLADQYIEILATYNHLFEGTIELLDYLSPTYKLHIITNGFSEVQKGKLHNSGIAPYFEVVMDSERAGVKKPHPQIFTTALEVAGVSPTQALMVGDNLQADVQGARAVGMQAVYFHPNPEKQPIDDFQIQKLTDLKDFL